MPETQMNASEIKIKPSLDMDKLVSPFITMHKETEMNDSSAVSEFTSMKGPELYTNADHNIKIGASRGTSSFFKKK
ncbi:hypothetical protein [Bartonella tribocorum]|uniref:hypothetical protein n=1 Tax=Bartonella tribocorum TaxID=85701 RepID=UPI001179D29F|nr:hypothetical protein [Bartonella tribocorum]